MKPLNPARLQRAVTAAQQGRFRLLDALELLVVRRKRAVGELFPFYAQGEGNNDFVYPEEWYPVGVYFDEAGQRIEWEDEEDMEARLYTDLDGRILPDEDD